MAKTGLALVAQTGAQIDSRYAVDDAMNGSGGSTTTGVSDALEKFGDNELIGKHCYLDGGAPSIRDLNITDSVGSSGTVTFRQTLGGAPDSLTYLILPYARADIIEALKKALIELYERSNLRRTFQYNGLVGGSMIYNGAFEYWTSSTVPDGWAATSTTLARAPVETTELGWAHNYGVQLSSGTGDIHIDDEISRRMMTDLFGEKVRIKALVKPTAASQLRAVYLPDGSTATNSSYATNGAWGVVDTGDVDGEAATSIDSPLARIDYDDANSVGIVAQVWSVSRGIQIRDYAWPVDFAPIITRVQEFKSPIVTNETVLEPQVQSQSGYRDLDAELQVFTDIGGATDSDVLSGIRRGILHFSERVPSSEHRMLIDCEGPITEPSADTDNIELDALQAEAVTALAGAILLEENSYMKADSQKQNMLERAGMLRRKSDGIMKARSQTLQRRPETLTPAGRW